MLLKSVYVLACWVLSLARLVFRGDLAKDAELLVLRHENAVEPWPIETVLTVWELSGTGSRLSHPQTTVTIAVKPRK